MSVRQSCVGQFMGAKATGALSVTIWREIFINIINCAKNITQIYCDFIKCMLESILITWCYRLNANKGMCVMKKILMAIMGVTLLAGCDAMVEVELSEFCQEHYDYSMSTCDCIAEQVVAMADYVGGDEGLVEISNLMYIVEHGNLVEKYQGAALLEVLIAAGYEECK